MTPRPLSPLVWNTQPGPWCYVLECNLSVALPGYGFKGCHVFIDSGKTIAKLDGCVLTIFQGYAWNGCTGAPSPPATMLGSVVHDVLYQFGCLSCAQWTRQHADRIFRQLLRASHFPMAAVYYAAVRLLGWRFYRKPPSRSIACLIHHLSL